jgi:3-oxoadipate enol-lactonase
MAKVNLPSGFSMNVETHSGLAPIDTVFMHGNLASNTWWHPALEVWEKDANPKNEGRLIFAEWRGCGKSDGPKSQADLHPLALADDYILLLRELGVKKACVVAHSTGGLIAMYAMIKAPELFDRAVFLDPVGPEGVKFEKPMYDAFTQMSKDREFCKTIMASTIHNNDASSPLFEQIVDDAFNISKELWHGVPNVLSNLSIVEDLQRLTQPVLILHGELDPILPKEVSAKLATQLPNARYLELKGQGHSTNVENPALFVQTVNEFLFHRP